MEMQTMGVNHYENANASNMTEAMLRRLFMRITWHQYPTLMTSRSNACFESEKPCTKSFVLLFRLIHFFRMKEFDCCGRETIGMDVKTMMALKVNAYGVAANPFHNYYQMGESTARTCCECFSEVLSHCNELTHVYLLQDDEA